jgi:hypothetical protein
VRTNANAGPAWYFTAPWYPLPLRRGDALGLRAGADYFADLLAPGLNNNSSDARWITLLSWCLCRSHEVWRSAGGGDLSTREGQRARYAWLRPLELLWVDRALEAGVANAQLPGRLSVGRWRKANRKLENFAMSEDQFRRYRVVGAYGGYRVVFRAGNGLTGGGDGWTPGTVALELSKIVNAMLPRDARPEAPNPGRRWSQWEGDEARFWLEHGWPSATRGAGRGPLPSPRGSVEPLPAAEAALLAPALFARGSVRRTTAEALADAKSAASHADLCDALAASNALAAANPEQSLAPLPAFTRFADAAMHAMRGLWSGINQQAASPSVAIADVLRRTDLDLEGRLDGARTAAEAWLGAPGRDRFPHDRAPTALAEALLKARSPRERLLALAHHHQEYGGGRRWFREQAGSLVPLLPERGVAASDYRFRLRPLIRMAAQCGVAELGPALRAVARNAYEELDSPDDEEADAT